MTAPPPRVTAQTAGTILLAIAFAAAGTLVLARFTGAHLPGCGFGGGCDAAAASRWGRIPGTGIPTSFVGVAYFGALAAAWLASRGRIGPVTRWIIRLGALVSVLLTIAMGASGLWCLYCIAVHAANLGFWALVERTPAAPAQRGRAIPAALATFIVIAAALGAGEWRLRTVQRERAERELAASIAKTKEPTAPASDPMEPTAHAVEKAPPFTGRHRWGPEAAAIRVVVFSDYQCQDCLRIERELFAVLAKRTDTSLSIKQFPFCSACNIYAPNLHPNACWAARAAEAAGILKGDEGFKRMHEWLSARSGAFTDAELNVGLASLGYTPGEFIPVMMSDATLAPIKADIEEGMALGLQRTPMIFINGVELRGWDAPQAVTRAIDQIAASNPPPRTAAADHPPPALEKFIEDWRTQPVRTLPPDAAPHAIGPEDAPVQVVLFGDYQGPLTAEADRVIRAQADAGAVRYTFRHYPLDQSCNPAMKTTIYPGGCRASRAAEAAALAPIGGGETAYWKVHAWLLAHQETLTPDRVPFVWAGADLPAASLSEAMASRAADAAIADDIKAAQTLGITGAPMIFVNNRLVPRWKMADALGGAEFLSKIIAAAGQAPAHSRPPPSPSPRPPRAPR